MIINSQLGGKNGAKINLTMYNNNLRFSAPIDLTGITNFNMSALIRLSYNDTSWFDGSTGAAFINANALTTINQTSCQYLFVNCTGITSADLPSLKTISGERACMGMFYDCTGLTSISLPSLTTISGEKAGAYMFDGCTGLTSISLPSLTTISGEKAGVDMFYGCTGLTSISLPNLTTINGQYACNVMFYNCTGLTSVDLSNLSTVSGGGACQEMFNSCPNLKNIYLPKIQSGNYDVRPNPAVFSAFQNSGLEVFDARNIRTVGDYGILDNILTKTIYLKSVNLNSLEHIGKEGARALLWSPDTTTSSLSNIYFPMLTSFGSNPFYTNAFTGRTNLTIHFRKDAQATVEALANYATLWGAGTGSSVVFDLAGTLTGADSNSYARSEKNSVYASETAGAAKTATAWSYNNTIYYTSGGAEPSVGDTIYSDSACTQAVTTISSIA